MDGWSIQYICHIVIGLKSRVYKREYRKKQLTTYRKRKADPEKKAWNQGFIFNTICEVLRSKMIDVR
jgi:hypothetical protein